MSFFISTLILIFILSAGSFWSVWIALELFTLYVVSVLLLQNSNGVEVFNYFFTQSLGSFFFFAGVLLSSSFFEFFFLKIFLAHFGLFINIGAFPTHTWTLPFIENLNWNNVAVSMGLPNMSLAWAALLLLAPMPFLWVNIFLFFLAGSIIPSQNLKMTSLKSIFGYSTIVQTSWILSSCFLGKNVCIFYSSSYLTLLFPVCFFFYILNINSFKDLFFFNSLAPLFFFAGFAGIPPFFGFLSNITVVAFFLNNSLLLEVGALGVFSILPIFLYMNLFFFVLMNSNTSKDFSIINNNFFFSIYFFLFISFLPYFLFF